MSKREHNNIKDVPFSENLVFYAPLTQGDLTDHISGVSPTTDSGCSVEWDSDKGMYLLSANGKYKSGLIYRGMQMGLIDRQACTVAIDVLIKSNSNYSNAIISTPELSRYEINNTAYIHGRNGDMSSLCTCCVVVEQSNPNTIFSANFYNNGNLITTTSWRASIQLSYNEVNICETCNYNQKIEAWVRNARIYNRALSASEVAQL